MTKHGAGLEHAQHRQRQRRVSVRVNRHDVSGLDAARDQTICQPIALQVEFPVGPSSAVIDNRRRLRPLFRPARNDPMDRARPMRR